MDNITGLITAAEKALAEYCLESIIRHGATQARVSLNKNVDDSIAMRDGSADKVMHSSDRSVFIYVYADGKYGTFSTNMLDKKELDTFIDKAVKTVKLLEADPCRTLPQPERTAKDALTGRELGLFDEACAQTDADHRYTIAEGETIFSKIHNNEKYRILSEECEYSETIEDNYLIDSQGFHGRHTETNFGICSEITIEDNKGRKFSGYNWDAAPFLKDLPLRTCSEGALQRAVAQLNPKRHKGGKLNAIVDTKVASRLVSPILSGLNALSIQQKTSFLCDSLGKDLFPNGLNIMDLARTPGKMGSRLYDSEGVATKDIPIIRDGQVMTYFVNTYMANTLQIVPTIEGVSRPVLLPYGTGGAGCKIETLLKNCDNCIYITGFNGGNCNSTTGDFSYGVEGFVVRDGEILHPVREMLMTGNILSLWKMLIGVADDARSCTRWQIPSLAFENVDFSG